ncbi:hypothetical protein LZ32DRAFT_148151 [Colletotrichum eremochloae]|nr:hypothetical protein LZ32DRAFT_148151 [Colletotrichum eremochloae]
MKHNEARLGNSPAIPASFFPCCLGKKRRKCWNAGVEQFCTIFVAQSSDHFYGIPPGSSAAPPVWNPPGPLIIDLPLPPRKQGGAVNPFASWAFPRHEGTTQKRWWCHTLKLVAKVACGRNFRQMSYFAPSLFFLLLSPSFQIRTRSCFSSAGILLSLAARDVRMHTCPAAETSLFFVFFFFFFFFFFPCSRAQNATKYHRFLI